MTFQVRVGTLQAFNLGSKACCRFGWGFCFIRGFFFSEPLGENSGSNFPEILKPPEEIWSLVKPNSISSWISRPKTNFPNRETQRSSTRFRAGRPNNQEREVRT